MTTCWTLNSVSCKSKTKSGKKEILFTLLIYIYNIFSDHPVFSRPVCVCMISGVPKRLCLYECIYIWSRDTFPPELPVLFLALSR